MLKRTGSFVQPIRVVAAGNAFAIFAADAGIAQLVERQLPKLNVAGSNPVARSTRRLRLLGTWLTPPARGLSKGTPPRAWSSRCAPAPAACASPRSAGSRCATGAANFLSECQAPGDFARRDGANRFATHLATITLNILFRGRA